MAVCKVMAVPIKNTKGNKASNCTEKFIGLIHFFLLAFFTLREKCVAFRQCLAIDMLK